MKYLVPLVILMIFISNLFYPQNQCRLKVIPLSDGIALMPATIPATLIQRIFSLLSCRMFPGQAAFRLCLDNRPLKQVESAPTGTHLHGKTIPQTIRNPLMNR